MKKLILTGILIASFVALCGCSRGDSISSAMHPVIQSRLNVLDRQESRANTGIQKIIDALNAKDREAVKAAFSSSALDETGDIEGGIDYLFALIPDEIQDYEKDTYVEDSRVRYGHEVVEMKEWYTVSTQNGTYAFFILEYTKDTDHSENRGIYALRACKEEDKAEHFSSWQKMKIAGIYVPDES